MIITLSNAQVKTISDIHHNAEVSFNKLSRFMGSMPFDSNDFGVNEKDIEAAIKMLRDLITYQNISIDTIHAESNEDIDEGEYVED